MRRAINILLGNEEKLHDYQGSYYQILVEQYRYSEVPYIDLQEGIKKKTVKASRQISLIDGIHPCSTSKRDITGLYGRPVYDIRKLSTFKNEILMYRRISSGKYRERIEMHLYNDRLFYFSFHFPYLSNDSEKQDVIRSIEDKYLDGRNFNYNEFDIEDENRTIISIDDCFILKINHVCLSSDFFSELSSFKENVDSTGEFTL